LWVRVVSQWHCLYDDAGNSVNLGCWVVFWLLWWDCGGIWHRRWYLQKNVLPYAFMTGVWIWSCLWWVGRVTERQHDWVRGVEECFEKLEELVVNFF